MEAAISRDNDEKYILKTVISTDGSRVDINKVGPQVLIEDAKQKDNALATFPNEDGIDWISILPLQQPEDPDSFAGMNAPFIDRWYAIDEMDPLMFAANSRFIIKHLEEPDTAVGYNYSQDQKERLIDGIRRVKFKPNSWEHFHMHWIKGVSQSLQTVKKGELISMKAGGGDVQISPRRYLREAFSELIEDILTQQFEASTTPFEYMLTNKDDVPFVPEGGITFTLPEDVYSDPFTLGETICMLHNKYLEVHKDVWNIFTSNYDQVQKTEWNETYTLHSASDIKKNITSFTDENTVRDFLNSYYNALHPDYGVENTMNWLYKSPSYSMSIYRHDLNYVVSLLPHIMHPTNWLAAMGIFELRGGAVSDMAQYRENAKDYVKRLGGVALVS